MTKDTIASACDTCAYAEGIIKRLEDKNAKLLADWRKMENALGRISAFGDGEHSTIAHDIIRELSYQDSPTAHD